MNLTIEYIAGFIDGEGCISLETLKYKWGRTYRPALSITNTHLPALLLVKNFFGCGGTRSWKQDGNRKLRWVYYVSGAKRLQPILHQLRPYLVIKAPQADLVMAYIEEMRPTIGKKFSHEERIVRTSYAEQMRVLNHRGVN